MVRSLFGFQDFSVGSEHFLILQRNRLSVHGQFPNLTDAGTHCRIQPQIMYVTVEFHSKFCLFFRNIDIFREIRIFFGKSLSLVFIDLYPQFSFRLTETPDPFGGFIDFAA